jgi:hypothetical protein
MLTRRLVVAAAIPLLLTSMACSEKEKEEKEAEKAKTASCDGKLSAAKAEANLPAEVPAGVSGATFYDLQTDGATKRYFAYVTGDDVVKTRDTIKTAFTGAGYEIEGTDEEGQAEAEFEFVKGSTEGSVQVIPHCSGYQRVRWRVGPK